eukprot:m.49947 g.49947  ORF g.49947 m.49947 type:complete len:103 (+) comp48039_c0_seq1:78-386(+)
MPILHIVSWKTKEGVTDAQVEHAFTTANLQALIPQVHHWVWGKNITVHSRPVDTKGFNWIMKMEFDSEDDLTNIYAPHPAHEEAKKLFAIVFEDRFVLDLVI